MLHLDHIILLVPHPTLKSLPGWITENFTVSLGGRHADGKTENKLICFKDGSYIELISFVNDDPKNRDGHWWGLKEFGIIDFAFTDSSGDASIHFVELKERLDKLKQRGVNIEYDEPVAGGRTRPDGVDVKWEVTFPISKRGEIPFFCQDCTERKFRVPLEEKNIVHPSGAIGIKQMSIYLDESRFPAIVDAYSAILGVKNNATSEETSRVGVFSLGRLYKVDGKPDPNFKIQVPSGDLQSKSVEERGGLLIGDLVLACQGSGRGDGMRRIDDEDDRVGGIFLDYKV